MQDASDPLAGFLADPGADPGAASVLILDAERTFRAPEGLFQMPHIASGTEVFEVTVPNGLQLCLVDLATPDAVPLAGAEVENRPARGATGRVSIRVKWSYPVPMGRITFRLRVHASPDGRAPVVTTPITEPGAERRVRALVEQDSPFDLAVDGPLAKLFHDQILDRGGTVVPLARALDGGAISGPTAAVIITLAVIAAICVVIGMAAFAAVIFFAISKGYNVDNAGYKVATGQGDSRQEHQMVFNIRQPGT